MLQPGMYRIKLAGAFPVVIPKHIDKAFDHPRRAVVYALTQVMLSNKDKTKPAGFTRFTIHGIGAGGWDGPKVAEWVAGEQ